jgi:hypothetical protein
MVAQMLKQKGKWMWRLERVVLVEGCGGVTGGDMAEFAAAGGLEMFPQLVSLRR